MRPCVGMCPCALHRAGMFKYLREKWRCSLPSLKCKRYTDTHPPSVVHEAHSRESSRDDNDDVKDCDDVNANNNN